MKRKFLYLLLTLCLLGQCLPAFAAQAPVLERIAFSGATIVGQFKSDVYQYQLVLDNAAVSPKLKSYKVQGEGNLFVTYDTDSTNHQTAVVVTLSYDTGSANIPLLTRTPQLMLRTARTTWTRSPAPWVSWCRR